MRTRKRDRIGSKFRSMMCICSGDQVRANDTVLELGSVGGADQRPDSGDIEEAESSLRESGSLNYEEARAMLGRFEYQKGNVEAALQVFEGIDINAISPKIKDSLSRRRTNHNRHYTENDDPPMSSRAAGLLLEAIFLKAKSLQTISKFTEAGQSCKVILDIVESSLPDGLPENFGADCKLQETLIKAVELLPELWKLAVCPEDTVTSYRRALLYRWNLDDETKARIQKEFAIYLMYSGCESITSSTYGKDHEKDDQNGTRRFLNMEFSRPRPPNLDPEVQSFMPKSNLEEAILLLMLLFRKANNKVIAWDEEILDHLSFALSVSGLPLTLAHQLEELLPGIIERNQRYYTLGLCYYGDGDSFAALNLLRKLLATREEPTNVPGLLLASKVCGHNPEFAEEGVQYARRALENMSCKCNQLVGTANCLLGRSLSEHAKLAVSDPQKTVRQSESIDALKKAWNLTGLRDTVIAYHLSLRLAEQRKLGSALHYAQELLKLEAGANLAGWVLMARILSAQKEYVDAEKIIDAALKRSVEWDQGQLLRTKAKLQVAQGLPNDAIKTYTQLLAILHFQRESSKSAKVKVIGNYDPHLESETWLDLVYIYIRVSSWSNAEDCLSKSRAINPNSASGWHALGSLHEAKGMFKEALGAFTVALSVDSNHVPSLVSLAVALRHLSNDNEQSFAVIRSFLMQALGLDRMNHSTWHQLGLFYKAHGSRCVTDAVECFQAATIFQDTAPVEPFCQ